MKSLPWKAAKLNKNTGTDAQVYGCPVEVKEKKNQNPLVTLIDTETTFISNKIPFCVLEIFFFPFNAPQTLSFLFL